MKNAAQPRGVQPYLFFEGRCEQALDFYVDTFGAEITELLRVKDNPEPPPPGMLPPGSDEKIMHAEFAIGDTAIMASDGMCSGSPEFKGISLSYTAPDTQQARALFDRLADSGEVRMPLGATFFSPCFGIVGDRFGVAWMINVAAEDA
jgi:PhnB protein